MIPYREFQPTGFDAKGLGLLDLQDWLVAPVSQTRDSSTLARSNYRIVLADIAAADPENEDHEEHRFGHWGPGWFELIIVRPDSPAAHVAANWEEALSNYRCASEEDWSELQCEEASEYWSRASIKDRIYWCDRYGISIFAARRDELPSDDVGELINALADGC